MGDTIVMPIANDLFIKENIMVAGHLREQNGYFQIVLSWKNAEGKRKTKSISTGLVVKGNKKRAEAMLLKMRQEFNPDNLLECSGISFSEFLMKWLNTEAKLLEPEQYASITYVVKNNIIPYFKTKVVVLSALNAKDLENYYRFERQQNEATVQELMEYHRAIMTSLAYAVELGWIKYNPAETVNPYNEETSTLFTEFLLEWLEMMESKVEKSTYGGYVSAVKKSIIPYFEKQAYTLQDLEKHPKYIQEYYQTLLKSGLSSNTVLRRHANIRKCLQYAFQIGLIKSNPADRIERPRKNKYVATIYNQRELEMLFQAVQGDPLELGVILAAFYGLRRSEVVGLKWEAIDFTRKTISIQHTVTEVYIDGKSVLVQKDRTKTKSSHRTLPLVPPFEKLLRKLYIEQKNNQILCGDAYCKDYLDYIYVNAIGELITPGYISQHFPIVLKKNKLKHIRFHDLRHSCASLLYAHGVSLKEIQEWLGHSDIGTTSNIYTHLDYSSKISSANAILGIYPTDDKDVINV